MPAPLVSSPATARWLPVVVRLGLIGLVVAATSLPWLRLLFRSPTREIASGSMATALYGAHFAAVCPECSSLQRFELQPAPDQGEVICGNCGASWTLPADSARGGDRVRLDVNAYRQGWPARGDLVAFYSPQPPHEATVKRVVGLPGEQVSIENGDLLINGRRVQKSLEALRRMAIQIHDDKYRAPSLPVRWQAESEDSRWLPTDDGYRKREAARVPAMRAEELDWLVFHNWPCMPDPFPPAERTESVPLVDHYPYNQGRSRSQLHLVRDVGVEMRIQVRGSGRWAVRIGSATWIASVRQRQWTLLVEQRKLASGGLPGLSTMLERRLQVAVCDGRFLLGWDDRPLIAVPLPAENSEIPATVAVGGSRVGLRLTRAIVYRDVYYLDPFGGRQPWLLGTVPPDGIALLGDNPPASIDSRQWEDSFVRRKSLIGKVLRVK